MATDDPKPLDSDRDGGTRPAWFGRRKRIVSREIHSEPAHSGDEAGAIAQEMQSAAERALAPSDLIESSPPPLQRPADALVLDPTAFSVRHRKHSENRTYRLAQTAVGGSFVAGASSIVTVFIGDHGPALGLAIGASALAVIGVLMVRSSRLAYRLRGYAAAAGVFSVIALGLTFIPAPAHEDDGPPGKQDFRHDPRKAVTAAASHPTTASTRP